MLKPFVGQSTGSHPARWRPVLILAISSAMAACRVIGTAVIVTVGAVGLAGYAVYKTGEAVVTGVGAVGAGVVAVGAGIGSALTPDSAGRSPASESRPVTTVVLTDNEFKTEYLASLDRTWKAANTAFQKSGFQAIAGERSEMAGVLTAQAWEGVDIQVKLKSLEPLLTEVRIRVGLTGNIKSAETIHKWILAELNKEVAP